MVFVGPNSLIGSLERFHRERLMLSFSAWALVKQIATKTQDSKVPGEAKQTVCLLKRLFKSGGSTGGP